MIERKRIAAAFGQAASTYDTAAALQNAAAHQLAERILGMGLNPERCLEIGCGTGGLTHRLVAHIGRQWWITDLAPEMVEACRQRISAQRIESGPQFAVMDGEAPTIAPGSMDLIVSNLAVQWFETVAQSLIQLSHCLTPNGQLLVTTLGAESFTQWQAAIAATGHQAGTLAFPALTDLQTALPQARIDRTLLTWDYADGREFLHSLHALGAKTPRAGHRPVPVGALRRAISAVGRPCPITYEILTIQMGPQ